ncbi:SusC/RagA family TonB-linked outer membrane protein [Flavobacterium sp. MFBS3-15]|uniref:SusC/RagA family TonB-linked outer membrane protein n=1 Tax=Flavobacterium sp. MFBS3-15 TaxID=2989816 RepID=UPI00223686E0|nr:SusC/RagA family TonB-linked outer membrane protein [Flavobacterium sp. MFBS3-15]MCW4468982.1 SusC/RagA family TonB-linked outer membrane protein [Flavobacterium sp. MFBS3-15]
MKTKLHVLLTLLFALTMQISFAQERTVSGTVTDEAGMPIPGVSILIKGTTTGTQTDFDGKFQIQATPEQTLVFSYIGMGTREMPASATTINVTLEDQATELEGVVVTAVGIRREKSSIGAATTTLKSDEILEGQQTNISDAIKGKVAGVVISNSSTDPGASSSVMIRGIKSLTKSNQPLYVVDGVPLFERSNSSSSLNNGYDFGNAASDINPQDIESMTILKGASATVLYGSRAAGGVILITTKKGKEGRLNVEYTNATSFTQINRTPKYQSTFGQGWDGVHYLGENGSWGPRFDGLPRVWGNIVNNSQLLKPYSFQKDQLENFFTTGTSRVNSVSVSGGHGESTVRLSYTNTQQDGIYPTDADSFERNVLNLAATSKFKNLSISGSMSYVSNSNRSVGTGQGATAYNNLMQIPTDIPITEFADYNNPFHNVSNYYTPYGVTNPYFSLNENGAQNRRERVYGSFEATYTVNDWFNATYRFGMDFSTDRGKIWTSRIDAAPGSPNDGSSTENPGSYAEVYSHAKMLNHDIITNFDFELTEKLKLQTSAGFNIQSQHFNSLSASVASQDIPNFFNLANSSEIPAVGTNMSQDKIYGLYNTTTLSYDDQLFLTGNVRNDWFSTLPEDNRSQLYAGGNLSWVFSRTFSGIDKVLNYGKLRVGYGSTGTGTDPYQVFAVNTPTNVLMGFGNLTFPINGINAYGIGNRMANLDLRPEIKTEFEVGTELSFFNNLVTIDATYFDAKVKDQILDLPLAPSTGYTSQRTNVGTLRTKGFEGLININWVRNTDGFSWSSSLNYTKAETILEELDPRIQNVELGGLTTMQYLAEEGKPVGLIKGYVPERDNNGNIVVDVNGVPVASPNQEVYGDTQYDYTMGISNTLSWKGLSLDFTFDVRQGGLMFSRTADITRFTGNSITTMYNDRNPFIVPNSVVKNVAGDGSVTYTPNTTPVDVEHMDDYYRADANARQTVIDKSFVKLREVVLSYKFPSKLLEKTQIQSLTFSVIGRNLFLWTPSSNQYIDPEASTFGNDLAGQFGEFSANPSTRSLGFSLKATF